MINFNFDSKDLKEMYEKNPYAFSGMIVGVAASFSRILVSLIVSARGVKLH